MGADCISSSCVPEAVILPLSMRMIMSASCTEATRCAMISLVVSGMNWRKPLRISASVLVSTALVESSRISIFGFLSNALAMQRRCF